MEGALQKGNDFVVCTDRSPSGYGSGSGIYIRNAVCIGFIANEVLSIVENAGLMGVPMPSMIKKAVDILKDTAESGAR